MAADNKSIIQNFQRDIDTGRASILDAYLGSSYNDHNPPPFASKTAGVADKVQFRNEDLFETDFKEASVVTLYLLQSLHVKLRTTRGAIGPRQDEAAISCLLQTYGSDSGPNLCQHMMSGYRSLTVGEAHLDDLANHTIPRDATSVACGVAGAEGRREADATDHHVPR